MGLAAVILAGGRARRLGGVDKVALTVDGRTLLDRSLDAVADADPVVIVGPRRDVAVAVTWTREEPPGAGPLAALAAGLAALPEDLGTGHRVAVLAGDLLGVRPDTVTRLRAALDERPGAGGALLVDDAGFRQWMHGVWRLGALREQVSAASPGAPLREVLGRLPLVEVAARGGEAADVDTPDDLP